MKREEIKPLRFTDDLGVLQFIPQRDVTAIEAVLLAQMFARMAIDVYRGGPMDFRSYINHNMLDRHFEEAHD